MRYDKVGNLLAHAAHTHTHTDRQPWRCFSRHVEVNNAIRLYCAASIHTFSNHVCMAVGVGHCVNDWQCVLCLALVRLGTAQQYWMDASGLGRCFLDYALTFGSRVVSVLGSGAVGPGFKSQPRRCRVTVLGKLFTPIAPLFSKQQNR